MEFSIDCFRISRGSDLAQYTSSDANQSLRVSRRISEESVEMKYSPLVHVWVGIGGVNLVIVVFDPAKKNYDDGLIVGK
jgi:hypothetical protein